MSLYSSTATPHWKSEFLERGRRNKRVKNEVPEWKRELLRRIHSKAEARRRMESSDKDSEPDEPVVEEHIPKVTENVFLKQEKQHLKSHGLDSEATGVIQHDAVSKNVVIIEKLDKQLSPPHKSTEVVDENEMPTSGIVSRLMGRFEFGKSNGITPRYRSKSTSSVRSRKEKVPTYIPVDKIPARPSTTSENSIPTTMIPRTLSTDRKTSYSLANIVPMPYHRSQETLIKSPVLSPKLVSPEPKGFTLPEQSVTPIVFEHKQETVDTSSLHAHQDSNEADREPERIVVDLKPVKNHQRGDIIKSVKLPNGEALHSSGQATQIPMGNNLAKEPDIVPKLRKSKSYESSEEVEFPQSKRNVLKRQNEVKQATTKIVSSSKTEDTIYKNVVKVLDEPANTPKEAKVNKKTVNNIYQKPERTKIDESKTVLSNGVVIDANINDMKSETAKVLFDIMLTSKTIQINPQKSKTTVINSNNINFPKPRVSETQNKKEKIYEQNGQENIQKPMQNGEAGKNKTTTMKMTSESLPATSIDDVIIPVEVVKQENAAPMENKISRPSSVPVESATRVKVTKEIIPTKSPSPVYATNNSNPPSIYGDQWKINKRSNKGSGGGTFTIDPSKFKKKTPIIISPTVQKPASNGAVPSATATKKKLTVDQITVIGGYVKLNRSCLKTETSPPIKRNLSATFHPPEKLETTYEYVSERSLIAEHTHDILKSAATKKTPGFAKDSAIGKYTPKYLLSMSKEIASDDLKISPEDDVGTDPIATESMTTDATPDDDAAKWSEDTSSDILF